jgi:hypothetical protein
MSESEFVEYRGDDEAAVFVTAYPIRDLDRNSPAVHAFYREALARLVPGMVMTGEPGPGVFQDGMALTCFTFSLRHIPVPMEDIIDWLRDNPIVRVIEIDRSGASNQPPNER